MAMARPRQISCSGPNCDPPVTGLRRFLWWPLFLALAALHLTVLPLLLAGDDRPTVLVAGAFYLLLATADYTRRHRHSPA
jgi:hypothetical protein